MNAIRLSVKSLLEFQRRSSSIEPNTLLPVCSNVKLFWDANAGSTVAARSGVGAYVEGLVESPEPVEHQAFLVESRLLFGLASNTKSEVVVIEVDADGIFIRSGDTELKTTNEPVENFPKPLLSTGTQSQQEPFVLTESFVRSLSLAKHFTSTQENSGNFKFVHIIGDAVFAMHNNHFYFHARAGAEAPKTFFAAEEIINIEAAGPGAFLYNHPNHHVIVSGDFTYTFSKRDGNSPNISNMLPRLRTLGREFNVQRDGVVEFCSLANLLTENPVNVCVMANTEDGKGLSLTVDDRDFSRTGKRVLAVHGECDLFKFNSRLVLPLLKIAPTEILRSRTVSNNWIIFAGEQGGEDEEYFVIIGMS